MSTVLIECGNVEYDKDEAKVSIDDLIDVLESAKSEGAEYVVGLSGNYRGPKYIYLSTELEFED